MNPAATGPVAITHYSDALCVWAYVAQVRLDELRRQFAGKLVVRTRFCSVFADTGTKMATGWKDRGGVAGYRAHVEQIIPRFEHVTLHPDAWARTVPTTSSTVHACIKAAELVQPTGGASATGDRSLVDELAWRLRLAFFRDGRDISRLSVQLAVAEELGFPPDELRAKIEDGAAWAALLHDYDDAVAEHVRGSPTFVLNERRQMLYGNVGYKIIEANVLELFRSTGNEASWC